jgi:hypothetical protein
VLTLAFVCEATAIRLDVRAADLDLVPVVFAATGFAAARLCVTFLCALVFDRDALPVEVVCARAPTGATVRIATIRQIRLAVFQLN